MSDTDFVDRIFNSAHSIIAKTENIASNVKDTLTSVVDSNDITNSNGFPEITFDKKPLGWNSSRYIGVGNFSWKSAAWKLGIASATLLAAWKLWSVLKVPQHLPQQQKRCVLVFGDVCDPIIRSQVMDLYRRRFVVFVISKRAKAYKEQKEEDDFLHHIDPSSSNDLSRMLSYLEKHRRTIKLVSILFMPNVSYYPSGEMSVSELEKEIRESIIIYFNALTHLIPHLRHYKNLQCNLYNPSLSYNLSIPHHDAEVFVSSFMNGIYRSLSSHKTLSLNLIHLGVVQIAGQPSNYKYLNVKGSNINSSLLEPVYKLIMYHNGNFLQRLIHKIITLNGWSNQYFCGKYSWLSRLPIINSLILSF